MLRALAIALLSSLSLPAFAAADLSATILSAPDQLLPGDTLTTRGRITNLGPDTATNVRVLVTAGPKVCETTVDFFPAGDAREYSCSATIPAGSTVYLLTAAIAVETRDQDQRYDNNVAYQYVKLITPPDLYTYGYVTSVPEPGLPAPLQIQYGNHAQTQATNAVVTIEAPYGFGSVPEFCSASGTRAVCRVGSIDPANTWGGDAKSFTIGVVAPDASEAAFAVTWSISSDQDDARPEDNHAVSTQKTYRTINVTSTEDHGSGTLRAAIETTNASCAPQDDDPTTFEVPCLIAFRIPPAARAWQTIRPASPLPRIFSPVFIDGTTQTGYFGDTNPLGPEIELDGADLREGNGFEVQCEADLAGMAIHSFPDNGVAAVDDGACALMLSGYPVLRTVRDSYIGVDPTGTKAMPNTRGVRIDVAGWRVFNSIVSGNVRAGIFLASGAARISGNRIGLSRDNQPLGNGAAGVFVGGSASGTDVTNNYIGFNHEFGVAIAADAHYVSANKNSLQGNYQQGIDWGLDGTVATSPVALPIITSVRFEDGKTIVEGTTTANGTFLPAVTMYANDAPDPSGYGEGQYVLGEVHAGAPPQYGQPMPWLFVYTGDLRGKWITATVTHTLYNGWLRKTGGNNDTYGFLTTTSEFSRAYEFK